MPSTSVCLDEAFFFVVVDARDILGYDSDPHALLICTLCSFVLVAQLGPPNWAGAMTFLLCN